jgi:SAM-dependent methyltransferase
MMSDFVARPAILEACRPKAVQGDCLDLGCGEGYFTRMLAHAGARSLVGSDVSTEMIIRAKRMEAQHPLGITYFTASITEEQPVASHAFDVVSAVHVINYLDVAHTLMAFRQVRRYVRPDGWFVFSVPHPFLVHHPQQKSLFFFEPPIGDYYSDRDRRFRGQVARIDGEYCEVLYYHKTFEDYFRLLDQAGFGRCTGCASSVSRRCMSTAIRRSSVARRTTCFSRSSRCVRPNQGTRVAFVEATIRTADDDLVGVVSSTWTVVAPTGGGTARS